MSPDAITDVDVVIIGAGISGLNAAYRLQTDGPPNTSYTVLEERAALGGTWDLWRYPGIRSDSDIFTFSFAWNPWPGDATLASGQEIQDYMVDSAHRAGLHRHIRYRHKVTRADWDSALARWHVSAAADGVGGVGGVVVFRSRFVFLGTGYYDYETPLQSSIPGLDSFRGTVIRPQFWPASYDYTDRDMVIIGSGATAVSILPAVAERVRHVTMLQRSPTYYLSVSRRGRVSRALMSVLPAGLARRMNRYGFLLRDYLFIGACRRFPRLMRRLLEHLAVRQLPDDGTRWERHFSPRYNPWEQRLCAVMDNDLFKALRSGKASVVTGCIDAVTEHGIRLVTGETLPADVIVAATGLQLRFGGGIRFSVDGEPIDPVRRFVWKACMLQDVPNLVFSFGYENMAWTLGADCAAEVLLRLIRDLDEAGSQTAVPRLGADKAGMTPKPPFGLSSTYLRHMTRVFPWAGDGEWRPRSHYVADFWNAKWGPAKELTME
ncbi:uncharacterized protein UV8b_00035 [Ustilaginoidea virens]|uniref:Uncharacterized protein n=1 Tax=Ustilaginoidea virens TaxID=1159556 RepID=A0A063BPA0_USTVR|nr:uncharacterized protein UV8b_00035 [Ustilaginoidea virens]QUC15794.1 hypothetical protein UV8b_00035 [Ustilaginoidea virens]GAO18705.1 hypothetical protein UVI_02053110 [Ustilaginoidea virens]